MIFYEAKDEFVKEDGRKALQVHFPKFLNLNVFRQYLCVKEPILLNFLPKSRLYWEKAPLGKASPEEDGDYSF